MKNIIKKKTKCTKENPYATHSTHIIGTMPAWLIDDPQEDKELDDKAFHGVSHSVVSIVVGRPLASPYAGSIPPDSGRVSSVSQVM
jgi:hypothetical protein